MKKFNDNLLEKQKTEVNEKMKKQKTEIKEKMENLRVTLGQLLKQERALRKMTKREMAKFLDVTPAYAGQLEADERSPSLQMIDKIGQKLEIPVGLLLLSTLNQNDVTPKKKEDFNLIMSVVKMALEKRYK